MSDKVEQQLGNYRLIRLLGEGGFARVYLGEHIYLGTQAAIKVLNTQLTSANVEWDTITNLKLFTFQHAAPVRVMAWSPEGKYIASGGGDATIQVWVAP